MIKLRDLLETMDDYQCITIVEYWNSLNKEGKRVVLERVGEEPCGDVNFREGIDRIREVEEA